MRRARGQLALGLAFAFAAVLAIFALVLQSSLITREKMKLQQTTDFAALVAADVQRHNLNKIRELHEFVEQAYERLVAALAANFAPCFQYYGAPTIPQAAALAATFGGYNMSSLGISSETQSVEKDSEGGEVCDKGCSSFDAFVKNGLFLAYQSIQSYAAGEIANIITKADEYAAGKALDTFLTPSNLPFSLRSHLQSRLGTALTLQHVKTEYAKGTLKDAYRVMETDRQAPLFLPRIEMRVIPVWRQMYIPGGCVPACSYCIPSGGYPLPQPVAAKLTREGNYTTSFLAGVQYAPPSPEFLKKLRLFLLEKSGRSVNEVLHDLGGQKIPLVRERQGMVALALAKPYGGSFPTEGDRMQPPPPAMGDRGEVGDRFRGAKLIGLADRRELDNYDRKIDGKLEQRDAQGRVTESLKTYQEDFLH